MDAPQFFRSYLYSYVFWVGISVGCLNWLMVQYLSGGAWGVMSRRVCESAAKCIPLWLVLFVPLILGISSLYGTSWANPSVVAHDPVLQHKAPFLNATFWIARGFIYLGGWSLLAFLLNRQSDIEDRDGGVKPRQTMAKISAPGPDLLGLRGDVHGHRLGHVGERAIGSRPCSACCSSPDKRSPRCRSSLPSWSCYRAYRRCRSS